MEAVINNTKLIRRVNIFALLILAVCVCAVAFLCKNMWLHIACTAALFLVMTIFGYWGKGLKFLVAFLISYGWLTPTSGLDGRNMRSVSKQLHTLAQKGHIILMITHDLECALATCSRALVIRDGTLADDFQIDDAWRLMAAMRE